MAVIQQASSQGWSPQRHDLLDGSLFVWQFQQKGPIFYSRCSLAWGATPSSEREMPLAVGSLPIVTLSSRADTYKRMTHHHMINPIVLFFTFFHRLCYFHNFPSLKWKCWFSENSNFGEKADGLLHSGSDNFHNTCTGPGA